MYTPTIRLALVVASVVAGAIAVTRESSSGWLFLIGAGLLIVGYFRNGTVWLAFQAERRGRYDRAAELLAHVRRPDFLAPQQRAYYDLLRGMGSFRAEAFADARTFFAAAVNGRLRTENDRALATGMLAASELEIGERESALAHLETAQHLSMRPDVKALVERVHAEASKVV